MSFALMCDQDWTINRWGISCDGNLTSVNTVDFATLDPILAAQWISAGFAISATVWGTAWGVKAVIRMMR